MPVLTSTTLYLIYPIKNSPGKHHYCNKIWWMHNNDCSRVVPSDSYYGKRRVTCFSSKKKLGLMDQILDYIEGISCPAFFSHALLSLITKLKLAILYTCVYVCVGSLSLVT